MSPDETTEVPDPALRVTDAAREYIVQTRAGEADATRMGLFVEVSGEHDGAYTYDMWFEVAADAGTRDLVQHHDDLLIVIAADSVARLSGATLDLGGDGLVITNPNAPAPPAGHREVPHSDLSSPLEIAVLEVLDQEINPQIAMHGGRADLVAVDDLVAYLVLSGGCQGCGLAAVTLSQGISVAIREAVPEIVDVVDVTAHGEGENPYFEAAKK